MGTELLYLKDSYLKEFDASVIEVDGNKVVLDRTAFYVQGGGQPSDRGKLLRDGQEFEVLRVYRDSGKIWHELSKEGLKKGDRVHGIIDWERRYRLMRMHTAAHVIMIAIQRLFPEAKVTGGQLDIDESRDDYSNISIDSKTIRKIEEIANKIVQDALPVEIHELPREEAFKIPGIFKLRDVLPPKIPKIRFTKIADDVNACGGTHVKNTKEIGRIKITRTKSKGKDNKRIYFTVEP